jgi:UDP-N-acetylmuramate dehydrogenase
MTPEHGVRLAPHTSLRVGGPADLFVLAHSAKEAAEAMRWAHEHGIGVRVVGGGTNLLVADDGFEGLAIKVFFARASVEQRLGEAVFVVEAGANFANQARHLAKQGLGGLEWAANVPGTIGGAVVNNAGAFGGDTASCLLEAAVVDADGRSSRLGVDELGYAYRTSALKRQELGDVCVERAVLRLVQSSPAEADGTVKAFNAQRMRTQPRIKSAGSVFANPDGTFAGKLIEEAGLKGTWAGGAQISGQHANFIVNPGGATARDVYTLMRQAQDAVFERTSIWLKPEIELLGRWSDEERAALKGPPVLRAGGNSIQGRNTSPGAGAFEASEPVARG